MDHALAVSVWVALGAATFPLLFFVSAPYGKLVRGGWGAEIDGRLGWFLQEIVSPITLTLAYLHGGGVFTFDGRSATPPLSRQGSPPPPSPLTQIFVIFWWAHYLNRSVMYPLTRSMSNTTVPVVAMAVAFNLINGTLVGTELAHGNAHLTRPRVITLMGGLLLFWIGAGVNITADRTLRRLRKGPGDRTHYVPRGGLFEHVTCPHYLGEVMEWTGFAVATQTRAGWAFAFWTFANLLPRAVAYRAWYRDKFGDEYPKGTCAMIPFVW